MQRQFRLRRSADFSRVRAQGKGWQHPFFTLVVAPNTLPYNRYGFVTSRRLGGAVVRNRVRRLLREALRHLAPHLRVGYDMVFLARNAILNQSYTEINRALEDLFRRADLLGGG